MPQTNRRRARRLAVRTAAFANVLAILLAAACPLGAVELELLLDVPRLELVEATIETPGGPALLSLRLGFDLKGKLVCQGACTIDGEPLTVKGSLKTTRGLATYKLVAKGAGVSVKLAGDLTTAPALAAVSYKGPRGKVSIRDAELVVSAPVAPSRVSLSFILDAKGKVTGAGDISSGLGVDEPEPGEIKGKLSNGRLKWSLKQGSRKIGFKGVETGSDRFLGVLSIKVPPAKATLTDVVLDGVASSCADGPDSDGDRISDCEEETVYGTAVDDDDTDGDGLEDGVEILDGWMVSVVGREPYVVHSDPLLEDTDADGLADFEEFWIGSDPRLADTDGDALGDAAERARGSDALDPGDPFFPDDPLVFLPMNGGLASATYAPSGGEKPATLDASGNDIHAFAHEFGPIRRPGESIDRSGRLGRALEFAVGGGRGTVLNLGHVELGSSLTLSVWVNRYGDAGEDQLLIGQRGWFSLRLEGEDDARAVFRIRDPSFDDRFVEVADPETFALGEWHLVTIVILYDTFHSRSAIRLYRDGEFVAGSTAVLGAFESPDLEELTLGGEYLDCNATHCFPTVPVDCCDVLAAPLSGALDDVRLYARSLSDGEVAALGRE